MVNFDHASVELDVCRALPLGCCFGHAWVSAVSVFRCAWSVWILWDMGCVSDGVSLGAEEVESGSPRVSKNYPLSCPFLLCLLMSLFSFFCMLPTCLFG